MGETPYLVDSNVLLRWVKPDHNDYPSIVSATEAILRRDGILCYTSQNVAEFWNACTRPADRNGYGLSAQEADRRARILRPSCASFRTLWPFTKSGANFW